MNIKIKIVLGVVIVVLVALVFIFVRNTAGPGNDTSAIPEEDPIDVVLDFYSSWLELLADTSVNPYESELFASSILSNEAREKVSQVRNESPDLDPFICQVGVIPERTRGRIFPASETEAKILIESRIGNETLPLMSFVTVKAVAGAWQIADIDCTEGDVAPEVEFTYNREGLLLKSVPPPFEAGKWHLVFEQDGQMGHVTPLFFSATTTCISIGGQQAVCNPDTFTETARVLVKGDMTEVGAEVQRVEFLQ
jgi:hypothetical protein